MAEESSHPHSEKITLAEQDMLMILWDAGGMRYEDAHEVLRQMRDAGLGVVRAQSLEVSDEPPF